MSRKVDQQPNQQQQPLLADDDGEEVVFSSGDEGPEGAAPWVLDGPEPQIEIPGPAQAQPQPQAPRQQQYQVPPPQAPGPVQSQPGGTDAYEIRLRTGHIFKGSTPEEATAAAQAHFDRLAGASYQQPQQYQTQAPPQRGRYQEPEPQPVSWNDEDFFKKFATSPRDAMSMWAQHYFGVDDPREVLDHSYSVAVQVSDRIAVADFLAANDDFPATPESGAILVKRLEADGQDLTTWNLEVAYRQLVREGVLAPIQAQAPDQGQGQRQPDYRNQYQDPGQYQQPQAQPQPMPRSDYQMGPPPSRGRMAPPPPGGSNPGPPADDLGSRDLSMAEFDNLSADDMARYMARRRQYRQSGGR